MNIYLTMKNFNKIALIITLTTHLYGCVGLDFVHSKTSTSGDPEKINDTEKITSYGSGLKWAGIYISLIVPIPLVIPYGRESETKWMRGQELIYQESIRTKTTGYGCAIWLECGELITWGHLLLEPHTYH
tara:strand:- start:1080 stop:1469 length:390 start_codon:yes stop_codon:yes gene_type:complete